MLRREQFHALTLCSVRTDGVPRVKVRVTRAEEVALVRLAAVAVAVKMSPRERWADAVFLRTRGSVVLPVPKKSRNF